jgi:hypothetical protein
MLLPKCRNITICLYFFLHCHCNDVSVRVADNVSRLGAVADLKSKTVFTDKLY